MTHIIVSPTKTFLARRAISCRVTPAPITVTVGFGRLWLRPIYLFSLILNFRAPGFANSAFGAAGFSDFAALAGST